MISRLRQGRRRATDLPPGGETFVIAGLGNPGKRYHDTRHNAGFMAIERLAALLPHGSSRIRFQADYVEATDGDTRVVLVKPQTFMNESGIAVGQIARWYKAPPDHILIVYDELDLPFGSIRLRGSGSAGGHNGMKSVIQHLQTEEFSRLRIGIGRPASGSTVPYVLAPFSASERPELPRIIDTAAEAALTWLRDGITIAMNQFNRSGGAATEPETPRPGERPVS